MKGTRILATVVLILLSSCAGSPAWQSMRISSTTSLAETNNASMLQLKIGQSKSEVISIMGPPTKTESYDLGNGVTVEFFLYRTQGWSVHEMRDADYQFTPVAFQNDHLVGWGRNYYDRVVRQQVEIKLGNISPGVIPEFFP